MSFCVGRYTGWDQYTSIAGSPNLHPPFLSTIFSAVDDRCVCSLLLLSNTGFCHRRNTASVSSARSCVSDSIRRPFYNLKGCSIKPNFLTS